MDDRVYILLDIAKSATEQVGQLLRETPGLVMADALEGPPDVVIVLEAPDRKELAELSIGALASIEAMTEHVRLLPAKTD